jgi:hypothetical protein
VIRCQARTNLWVNGQSMPVWTVETLPLTAEVGTLVAAGLLVPEAQDGSFPSPVVQPRRCCGQ